MSLWGCNYEAGVLLTQDYHWAKISWKQVLTWDVDLFKAQSTSLLSGTAGTVEGKTNLRVPMYLCFIGTTPGASAITLRLVYLSPGKVPCAGPRLIVIAAGDVCAP